MNYIIVLVVLISVVNCVEYKEDDVEYTEIDAGDDDGDYEKPNYSLKDAPVLFQKFMHEYKKTYETDEIHNKRYDAFVKNLKEIIENNGKGGSVSDINAFADYFDDELAKLTG